MSNLADLQIGVGVDTGGLRQDFNKIPDMAEDATDEVESKFEAMAPALASAAKVAAVGAGAALAGGLVIGMEREAVGDKLAAQLNLSEEESAKAGKIAGSLYAGAYGDSLGDVNEAVGAVVSTIADLDSGDVEQLSAKALDLAATFDTDVGDSVKTAGALLKSGLVSDADEAFDLIAAGMQTMPAALRDELGEATTEYSRFFADLGFSGEEAFGLLSTASDTIELDKIGDSLKELTIRATDMSTTSVEAFEAAGLDAEAMASKILAGGDTAREGFDQIVDGLLGIEDPQKRANAAIGLFGTPLEDLGTAQIPDFLTKLQDMGGGLGDVEGRASALGDTLNDNASVRITGVKRSIEGMLAKAVEAPGVLGAVAAGAAGMGAAMEPVAPAMTGLAVVFQDKLSAMASSVASSTASAVSSAAKWAASTAASAGRAVVSMATTTAQFIAHYARLAAQSMANAVRMAASWVVAMGPVGWVIAGVVALVALIIANWDKVKEWTGKAWSWVGDKVASVWTWIKGTTKSAVDAVVGFFTGLKTKVLGLGKALLDGYLAYIGWLRDGVVGIATGIRDRVVEFFGGLKDGAIEKVVALVDRVKAIKEDVLGFFTGAGTWLLDAGKKIVQGLIDGIGRMVGKVGDAIGSVTQKVRNFLPFSPAREGPMSGRGAPSIAGAKIASMLAAGMRSQVGLVSSAGASLAGAAALTPGGPAVPRLSSFAGARGAGGPSTLVIVDADGQLIGRMEVAADQRIGATFGGVRQDGRAA